MPVEAGGPTAYSYFLLGLPGLIDQTEGCDVPQAAVRRSGRTKASTLSIGTPTAMPEADMARLAVGVTDTQLLSPRRAPLLIAAPQVGGLDTCYRESRAARMRSGIGRTEPFDPIAPDDGRVGSGLSSVRPIRRFALSGRAGDLRQLRPLSVD